MKSDLPIPKTEIQDLQRAQDLPKNLKILNNRIVDEFGNQPRINLPNGTEVNVIKREQLIPLISKIITKRENQKAVLELEKQKIKKTDN